MYNLKRRYFDLRNGWQIIAPVFGFSNFTMLAYLTFINDMMPVWLFGLISTPPILIILIFIGNVFRSKQMPMDLNLSYVKATEAGKTVYEMMYAEYLIMKSRGIDIPQSFIDRMEYMRKISMNDL
jgi:hypothetical protein